MSQYYSANFLRMVRNDIPVNEVIVDLLNLEVRYSHKTIRFRCPVCTNFHTATNLQTNLARCFDRRINFNPIDMVITVENCRFVDEVKILKKVSINRPNRAASQTSSFWQLFF